MMFKKRGQAAMEFLMTYGWAILAAVIVVGVLWYMIGNPANLAGNNFQMAAPLVGNAMNISTSGITMEVRNGASESITVESVILKDCGEDTGLSESVNAGELAVFTVSCSPALSSGDRVSEDVAIKYTTSGSSVTQTATGSITGRVP